MVVIDLIYLNSKIIVCCCCCCSFSALLKKSFKIQYSFSVQMLNKSILLATAAKLNYQCGQKKL